MSPPEETRVQVNGQSCRVWSKGHGETVVFFAGLGGLPRWTPFLERLAGTRRVVAPSLPGFPGGGSGHEDLDSHLDWLVAAGELYVAAGGAGADLLGVSVGGAIAAEVAALWPDRVRRLALIGPFGLFDEADPIADVFAQPPGRMGPVLCADGATFDAHTAKPDDADEIDWRVEQTRAHEAAARILWPIGDTRLARRLYRIVQPTLLLWGEADAVVPPAYAGRFADAISGPTSVHTLAGAGHLADLDAPDAAADAVLEFLD